MTEERAELWAEKVCHAVDLLRAEIGEVRAGQQHLGELLTVRLAAVEKQLADQEARLRAAAEGVTQFKLLAGLAGGGSGLISLAALLRTFLGGG